MSQPVINKEAVLQRLSSNRDRIKAFGVKEIGLFGSFARNTAIRDTSDIDLLIEFYPDKKTFDNFMDLSFYLDDLMGRKVEIVTPQSLSKYIGPHILNQVQHVSF
jgi:uncharacterized protein